MVTRVCLVFVLGSAADEAEVKDSTEGRWDVGCICSGSEESSEVLSVILWVCDCWIVCLKKEQL